MTPEREEPGRGPRQDKAEPALRFDKGTDIETPGQKAKGRPAGAWKKAAARMSREQRPPAAEPVAPFDPGPPTDPPTPEQTGAAYHPTGPELPMEDDPPEGPADNVGPATSGLVGTSSTSLASPQAAKLTRSAAPPLPEKSTTFRGPHSPKYRQHSKRETREPGASSEKFRRDSKQAKRGPRASPAQRVAWGEEAQGNGRSFHRKVETE